MNACATYIMAKYVSKCEPHSKAMDTIYVDYINKLHSNSTIGTKVSQVPMLCNPTYIQLCNK